MPLESSPAFTEKDKTKEQAMAETDALLKPLMADGNRYMTGDGTLDKPVEPALGDRLTETGVDRKTATETSNAYETEYVAATTAQDKAQVAAKHGDWQKAYGNAQNVIGEGRVRETTYKEQLSEANTRQPVQAPQQPVQQQDPYAAFGNFQVVQPKDEYDDQAQRINEGIRNFTMQLGPALQQSFGAQIQNLTQQVEGLSKMPQNYAVDATTEATLVSELNLSTLPEWQQKQIVQRIAGQKSTNTNTTAPRKTPQERTVQRAVNYVEPSNLSVSEPSTESSEVAFARAYEAIGLDPKYNTPEKKMDARKRLFGKHGIHQVDDIRGPTR